MPPSWPGLVMFLLMTDLDVDDDVHDVDVVDDFSLTASRCQWWKLTLMTVSALPGWLGTDDLL